MKFFDKFMQHYMFVINRYPVIFMISAVLVELLIISYVLTVIYGKPRFINFHNSNTRKLINEYENLRNSSPRITTPAPITKKENIFTNGKYRAMSDTQRIPDDLLEDLRDQTINGVIGENITVTKKNVKGGEV